ncbi:ABC transporter permease [Candidatus Woesearchaeota archaeon CG_4_10_14_0_2_um_filter_33_13]|nr:MAG: ABC transporter permease [Candidatus Woesearchaeota archaeon CG_4_10_14_0_2_um_filter_33_13]
MIQDYFIIPWKEIRRKKVRSWLTLIGVFIGIAAIVSLVTLGQGLENAIDKQFELLGKDKLFISAKGGTFSGIGSSVKLREKDLDIVKGSSGIKLAAGMGYSNGKYEFNEIVRFNYVSGLPDDPEERALIGEAQTWELSSGRFLRKGDKYKVVLGYEYTQPGLFEKSLELGDKIMIQDQVFKVVGFNKKIGSPPDDKMSMIPLDTFSEIFGTGDELGYIIAQTNSGEDISVVAENVKKDLRKSRHLKEGDEDFNVETPEQLASSFSTILNMVQLVLIGIAAISLLVGGIGIMNTMYTAVLERTKEIGILKALGARNSQVLYLFLVESGLYGLGGGIIGVILGIIFAKITEFIFILIVGPVFLLIEINWLLISGTLLFSFVIGCLSGVSPARRASKLNPVDSLRYE